MKIEVFKPVADAINVKGPVVALESTVITHGLPFPLNISLATEMETTVRETGAIPATIAVLNGRIIVGADRAVIEKLACENDVRKISSRDLGPAVRLGWSGGTTVAGTMLVAQQAGIKVFATGGIGGVHRPTSLSKMDISADLPQLARTRLIVICAGVKAILDISATLEFLETWGVPILGYQTAYFPAFYSRRSGFKAHVQIDNADEIVDIAHAHWEMGGTSAVLVVNPIPEKDSLDFDKTEAAILTALDEADYAKIRGQEITPFLLGKMSEITDDASLTANLALLLNNARLAAEVAKAWEKHLG